MLVTSQYIKKRKSKQRGIYYSIAVTLLMLVQSINLIPSNVYLPSLESVKYFACFCQKTLMITKMIHGCLISTLLHIDIPYIVRSLFTLRKCWSVQMISVPCVSKSNMQRFCMNLRSPRETATSPQTKDLSRGPPEQIGLSLTFLCKLAVKP